MVGGRTPIAFFLTTPSAELLCDGRVLKLDSDASLLTPMTKQRHLETEAARGTLHWTKPAPRRDGGSPRAESPAARAAVVPLHDADALVRAELAEGVDLSAPSRLGRKRLAQRRADTPDSGDEC